ncbi:MULTISPECIES: hypothetical protein [Microbulbifer]|uniref:hypothetical protein n=1 Tax=Microbulbifer TaxID=48073 RepID=UPI001E56EDDA|nr:MULTISPECIES: hypothetical protein [Microbulbifer]UHQ54625.1 hypothetical protein LVE68_14105 [Microbulbifer sp. YPW16]
MKLRLLSGAPPDPGPVSPVGHSPFPIRLTLLLTLLCTQAHASGTLQLKLLTETGDAFEVEQEVTGKEQEFASGILDREAPVREYQAIKCDGPWGAVRYRMALPSGPGYQLELGRDTILLRIVEHGVVSENRNIEAMKIHCRDTEPRAVIKSLVEIQLDRYSAEARELLLPNGYRIEYSYLPDAVE